MKTFKILIGIAILLILTGTGQCFPSDEEISTLQQEMKTLPIGDRIAMWAEKFVGTPYDTDPLGAYVRNKVIVYDKKVDCMYHIFRSVELAIGSTPEDSVEAALNLRFKTKGKLDSDGLVTNYDDRFQYAEDMVTSGKWSKDVTSELGGTTQIKGDRGVESVTIVPKENIKDVIPLLKSGDIVFLIKKVEKRVVGEIVGHEGIIKVENSDVYLVHASGLKNKENENYKVKKVPLLDYAANMPFIGITVLRFASQ
ncbi:N-acetylmuramoyl-L-alanine amidase-like domain-containing protein [Candidatus Magnetomonas plexicatena]|uniref:N-acetylmuramoyl-L-alanine amidase-like domain-containing protein n=1 Tax=Candidatus Magnetomonas plexicatena TaxID=2552947 RepID=UPI001C7756EC|nr:DUF1460 domain-containing protein [Nitrospirales bacterium LBB_01]